MLADFARLLEYINIFFAELRVRMRDVVRVNQLRQAQCAGHAGRPSADDDHVSRHLRPLDAFNRFAEDHHYRLARLAISPSPSSALSAVTRVRFRTFAVAAKKRSAGSACGSDRTKLMRTISWVRGASLICEAALSTHS